MRRNVAVTLLAGLLGICQAGVFASSPPVRYTLGSPTAAVTERASQARPHSVMTQIGLLLGTALGATAQDSKPATSQTAPPNSITDPYWDTLIQVENYPTNFATPDYYSGEDTVSPQINNPGVQVWFDWDFAWYYYDQSWNYLGEEYQEIVDGPVTSSKVGRPSRGRAPRSKILRKNPILGRLDVQGRIRTGCGALPAKHFWQSDLINNQKSEVGYNDFVGQDLDAAGNLLYLPEPDILDFSDTIGSKRFAPLEFRRMWREDALTATPPAHSPGLPNGWFHNWDATLTYDKPSNSTTLTLPDGRDPSTATLGQLKDGYTVVSSKNGYTLTWVGDKVSWQFSGGTGAMRLSTVVLPPLPPSQRVLTRTLSWDGPNGALTRVQDTVGPYTVASMTLTYDAISNVLQKVESSGGHAATYTLASNTPSVVCTAAKQGTTAAKDRQKWDYTFDNKTGRLETIKDHHGRRHGLDHGNPVTLTVTRTADPHGDIMVEAKLAGGRTMTRKYTWSAANQSYQEQPVVVH